MLSLRTTLFEWRSRQTFGFLSLPTHDLTFRAPATGSARDAGVGRGVDRGAAGAGDPGDAGEGVDQRQRRRRRRRL